MPFSVSAGVGFIALFGIAVLNGIVLIEHLKELQHKGMTSMRELILTGTKNRLRPVMLTAGVAAMGFLPMAISSGAGAELQRPLATVVIGGLFSSTLLTMIALPLLFEIFYNVKGIKFFPLRFIRSKSSLLVLFLLVPILSAIGQPSELSLKDVIGIALHNNQTIVADTLRVEESIALKRTAFSPNKTNFSYGSDQNNIAENGYPLKVWGVEQSFNFPTLYSAEGKSRQIAVAMAEVKLKIQKNELIQLVSDAFFNCQLLLHQQLLYEKLDSLYSQLQVNSEKKVSIGETSQLEVLNIRAKKSKISAQSKTLIIDLENGCKKLKTLMNHHADFKIAGKLELLPTTTLVPDSLPVFQLLKLENEYYYALVKVAKNSTLPDLSVNYFLGSNHYDPSKYYHGFQVGVSLPLFFGSDKAKIEAAKISHNVQTLLSDNELNVIHNRLSELINEQLKFKALLDNYDTTGKPLYDEIIRSALKYYNLGEIDFYQFVSSYESAVQIQLEYFENLYRYNLSASAILNFSK
jgi:cobalt-zinc-cadmium resistance protein CzcA